MASYEHVKKIKLAEANGQNRESMRAVIEDLSYKEAVKRQILNSGQEFFFLFKYFIEKNGEMSELREFINQSIAVKNEGEGDRNLIIRFTK